ncbi:sigma-70 region 4 domain-containing protein, partial [Mycobacterium tuberculosis]|nr:sigma-70 region 4 domain-containing protein [Mycobacterium tuberculosis]
RREIFMAICVEEIPLQQVAKRFGISVRTAQVEIKQALVHCAVCIDRNAQMPRVGFRRRNPFSERDRAALHPASESDTLLGRRLPLGGSR